MALQQVVEQIVTGLGYDLVEIERSAGGLLRVTIDLPWVQPAADAPQPVIEQFVTVEDCEKVTRQLQFALEVDGVEYKRLEVSSPGIDRPLRHEQDFVRFEGSVIDITLKAPIGAAAAEARSTPPARNFAARWSGPRPEAGRSSGATSRRSSQDKESARNACPPRCRRWVSPWTNAGMCALRPSWTSRGAQARPGLHLPDLLLKIVGWVAAVRCLALG